MRPTNAQILEGRDEALEHLGISLVDWETSGPDDRRRLLRDATHDSTDLAAARTVIDATAMRPGLDCILWWNFWARLVAAVPRRRADYALQA